MEYRTQQLPHMAKSIHERIRMHIGMTNVGTVSVAKFCIKYGSTDLMLREE